MKVFDRGTLTAFVLFYLIPIFAPYAIIAWDGSSADGFLGAILFKLAYIYDDAYNFLYDMRGTHVTPHGYYYIPHLFASLERFESANSTFFKINFFTFAILNVISALFAWIVGTAFALNQRWPRSFMPYRLPNKEASGKFWIGLYLFLSLGLYFALRGTLFSPIFDKTSISIKLLALNAFGFFIPVYLRGLLSKS